MEGKMKNRSVLVVDDDSSVRELVSETLMKLVGSVATAVNGHNGLAVLQSMRTPDLIVVDLIMPKMDGVQFVRKLRSMEPYQEVPVILMTANHNPEFLLEAADLQLEGLLLKPVDANKLIEKVEKIFSVQGI
jgi:CheY-like chemotaxis protein